MKQKFIIFSGLAWTFLTILTGSITGKTAGFNVIYALLTGGILAFLVPSPMLPNNIVGFILRFLSFSVWLTGQMVLASFQVAGLVLRGGLDGDSSFTELRVDHLTELEQIFLTLTITLTPGTVALKQRGETLAVHCLTQQARESLESGTLQSRVRYLVTGQSAG